MTRDPNLSAYKLYLKELAEQRKFALKMARTQALRDVGASIAQASAKNPLWSQAAIGLAGAVVATAGEAIEAIDKNGKAPWAHNSLKGVGLGMMGFAGAQAAAGTFQTIAEAFSRDSTAESWVFDLGSPGAAYAASAAPPDFPSPAGGRRPGTGGVNLPPVVPIPIPIPMGPEGPAPQEVPVEQPQIVPIRDDGGRIIGWVPEGAEVPVPVAVAQPATNTLPESRNPEVERIRNRTRRPRPSVQRVVDLTGTAKTAPPPAFPVVIGERGPPPTLSTDRVRLGPLELSGPALDMAARILPIGGAKIAPGKASARAARKFKSLPDEEFGPATRSGGTAERQGDARPLVQVIERP